MVPCAKASPIFAGRQNDRRDAARGREAMGSGFRGGLDFHCERPHVLGRSASHGLRERSNTDRRDGDGSEANRWFWAAPCPME